MTLKKRLGRLAVRRGSAGLGLFALDAIPKDEFIIEYHGPLLSDKEADERGGKYLFEIDDDWTIDGTGRDNIARYINHSCRPNCEAEIDGTRVYIWAKRDIEPGEELTYHYGRGYFNDFIKPDGCKCPHCLGWGKKKRTAK